LFKFLPVDFWYDFLQHQDTPDVCSALIDIETPVCLSGEDVLMLVAVSAGAPSINKHTEENFICNFRKDYQQAIIIVLQAIHKSPTGKSQSNILKGHSLMFLF
jgi:hypothetical protein